MSTSSPGKPPLFPADLFGTSPNGDGATDAAERRPLIDWSAPAAEPTPPPAAPDQRRRGGARSDLSVLARGGVVVAFGTVCRGVLRFAYGVLLARGLGARAAGVVIEAMAVFSIFNNLTEFGADTGLSRFVPRYRALNQIRDLRPLLRIAEWPVLIGGALAAVGMYVWAPQLSTVFVHGASRSDAVT